VRNSFAKVKWFLKIPIQTLDLLYKKNMMKNIFTKILILTVFGLSAQIKYTFSGIGNWDDAAFWSPKYPGTTLNKGDELTITSGSEIKVLSINNYGTIYNNGTFKSYSSIDNYGAINNKGLFNNSSFVNNTGSFINDSIVSSSSFFTNEGTLVNNKKFVSNSFFENNGYFTDNGTFESNSFFNGENKSHKNDCNVSGIFSPGKSSNPATGKYVFNNNITISSGANVNCDITSSTVFDTIVVAGNAKIAGSLYVKIPTTYDPALGTSYTILTAASVTGKFFYLSLPSLTNNKKFEVSYTNTSVVVKVVDATVTDIDDVESASGQLRLYPNPASNVLFVNGLDSEENVSIYTASGNVTKNIKLTPINNHIDISDLAKGSYVIQIGSRHNYFVK
jgi:Secretion system C-terminal sorting domain